MNPLKLNRAVWRSEGLSPHERALLTVLVDRADARGVCYPSLAMLERQTRYSKSAVRRALTKLEHASLVSVIRGVGRGHVSVYTLNADAILDLPQIKGLREIPFEEGKGSTEIPFEEEKVSVGTQKRCLCDTQKVPIEGTQREGPSSSAPSPSDFEFPDFPCRRSRSDETRATWTSPAGLIAELERECPSTDVDASLRALHRKLRLGAQPLRTRAGMPRFVRSWVLRDAEWCRHPRPETTAYDRELAEIRSGGAHGAR